MENQIEFYLNKLQYEIDSADLYEALNNQEDLIVVDTRKPSVYEAEHIPGAINIPHREMNDETIKDLDRDTVYICYCDGIGCNASTKGALNLTRYGFKVKELLGGIDWWKRDGYNTEGTMGNKRGKITCGC